MYSKKEISILAKFYQKRGQITVTLLKIMLYMLFSYCLSHFTFMFLLSMFENWIKLISLIRTEKKSMRKARECQLMKLKFLQLPSINLIDIDFMDYRDCETKTRVKCNYV